MLQSILIFLRPGITFGHNNGVFLIDDGEGPYIKQWNDPRPQPTPEQIETARLPAERASVIERIKAERDRRKGEGVYVGVNRFHSDSDSRIQQLGLVILGANIPANLQWKTMGTGFVTMTQTLAGQIFGATAQRDITVFAVAESHIAAIAALTDADAVLAYDYSTGWPA